MQRVGVGVSASGCPVGDDMIVCLKRVLQGVQCVSIYDSHRRGVSGGVTQPDHTVPYGTGRFLMRSRQFLPGYLHSVPTGRPHAHTPFAFSRIRWSCILTP